MEIRNLNQLLDGLVKDEHSDIRMMKLTEDVISVFLARLTAGKKLPAHYHNAGQEIYQVLAGNGVFEMGDRVTDGIHWQVTQPVKAGDFFEVPAGKVHRLTGGSEDLRLVFFTPPSHLKEDRFFITGN